MYLLCPDPTIGLSKRNGLTPLSALSERDITALTARLSKKARDGVDTMPTLHFKRLQRVLLRLQRTKEIKRVLREGKKKWTANSILAIVCLLVMALMLSFMFQVEIDCRRNGGTLVATPVPFSQAVSMRCVHD